MTLAFISPDTHRDD